MLGRLREAWHVKVRGARAGERRERGDTCAFCSPFATRGVNLSKAMRSFDGGFARPQSPELLKFGRGRSLSPSLSVKLRPALSMRPHTTSKLKRDPMFL